MPRCQGEEINFPGEKEKGKGERSRQRWSGTRGSTNGGLIEIAYENCFNRSASIRGTLRENKHTGFESKRSGKSFQIRWFVNERVIKSGSRWKKRIVDREKRPRRLLGYPSTRYSIRDKDVLSSVCFPSPLLFCSVRGKGNARKGR